MRIRFYIFVLIFCFIFGVDAGLAQRKKATAPAQTSARTFTVITEPNATVWLNEVKRGETDESGKIVIKPIAPGSHKLRVRAEGFKEVSKTLTPAQKGDVEVPLTKTTDNAEIAFQEAEKIAGEDSEKAEELYKEAIKLRPNYPQAYIGLARLYSDAGDTNKTIETIKNLRKIQPRNSEASAIEGRVYISLGEEEKAVKAFERSISEGGGFQPEAYTGLGLYYKEKAEIAGSSGDFEGEKAFYLESSKALQKAVTQLSGAPDAIIIYQILGLNFEKTKEYKKAIAVYEDFLRTFPDSDDASAVQSFIVQIKKQMSEQ